MAEAAAILETTPKAVESRLYRARQLLRERLKSWLVKFIPSSGDGLLDPLRTAFARLRFNGRLGFWYSECSTSSSGSSFRNGDGWHGSTTDLDMNNQGTKERRTEMRIPRLLISAFSIEPSAFPGKCLSSFNWLLACAGLPKHTFFRCGNFAHSTRSNTERAGTGVVSDASAHRGTGRAGVLVATNAKVLKRLLASRFTVVSALLTPAWLEKLEPQLRARTEEFRIYVGEQKLLETITGYKLHQGALAVAKIPPQPDFETLLNNSPRPLLLAAAEGIASAENLGAVVRSCAAFGAHFLIVGETCGSGPSPGGFRLHGRHFRAAGGAGGQFGGNAGGVARAGRALPGGTSPARREEAGQCGFAARLLPAVRRGRSGPHRRPRWRRATTWWKSRCPPT